MGKKYVGITKELREEIENLGVKNVTNFIEEKMRELMGMPQAEKTVRDKVFTGTVLEFTGTTLENHYTVENEEVTELKKTLYGYVDKKDEKVTIYVTNPNKLPKVYKAVYKLVTK